MDLKIQDVADLLNVSKATIRRWIADGQIPSYRLGQQYRFSSIEIEEWVMKRRLSGQDVEAEEMPSPQRGGSQYFSLYRAIHQGGVLSRVPGANKEQVIRSVMVSEAPRLGLDPEVISELLLDREKLMPTALNHGIAVPHARDLVVEKSCDRVIVVFPQYPIPYGALDGEPVHTLFFLFASEDKRHLHLLAKLAHLGSSSEALAFLRTKPSRETLLEYIRSWESSLKI